jgi:hypothetical protein
VILKFPNVFTSFLGDDCKVPNFADPGEPENIALWVAWGNITRIPYAEADNYAESTTQGRYPASFGKILVRSDLPLLPPQDRPARMMVMYVKATVTEGKTNVTESRATIMNLDSHPIPPDENIFFGMTNRNSSSDVFTSIRKAVGFDTCEPVTLMAAGETRVTQGGVNLYGSRAGSSRLSDGMDRGVAFWTRGNAQRKMGSAGLT